MFCDRAAGVVATSTSVDRFATLLAFRQWHGWLCETKRFRTRKSRATAIVTHRTSAVAHPNVALDVQGRRPGKPERFHVREHLGLEHLAFAPRSSEPADQLVVHRATAITKRVGSVLALSQPREPSTARPTLTNNDDDRFWNDQTPKRRPVQTYVFVWRAYPKSPSRLRPGYVRASFSGSIIVVPD